MGARIAGILTVGFLIILFVAAVILWFGSLFQWQAHANGSFRPDQFTAAPTDAQLAACAPDAFRLCSHAIPDRDAVRFCMIRHRREISQTCKDAFR